MFPFKTFISRWILPLVLRSWDPKQRGGSRRTIYYNVEDYDDDYDDDDDGDGEDGDDDEDEDDDENEDDDAERTSKHQRLQASRTRATPRSEKKRYQGRFCKFPLWISLQKFVCKISLTGSLWKLLCKSRV